MTPAARRGRGRVLEWQHVAICWDQAGGTVRVMRVAHHKLVRDQIPAIITADGGQPLSWLLDEAGYEAALRAKLVEEAHEAQAAPDGHLASELADVLKVLQALATAHGMSWEDIASVWVASVPSGVASTTGSSSNTSTNLGNVQARTLDLR
jgi:predicted house-cleaning noncanonical NTP pyrophosphatase (MazG superfamily)